MRSMHPESGFLGMLLWLTCLWVDMLHVDICYLVVCWKYIFDGQGIVASMFSGSVTVVTFLLFILEDTPSLEGSDSCHILPLLTYFKENMSQRFSQLAHF